MAKFDINKTKGISNVLNAVQQVKNVNNILPLTEAKELLLASIFPSNENFYTVAALDELSDSIREFGVLQPLLVSEKENGVYEIIAGNRRYEAAKMVGLERLPCIVKQNVDPILFKIMLIHANLFRTKTEIERATEVAELKKAIALLKASDKSIKGRTNAIAGQILNLSDRQINRLDNLNKLIPEIQGMVQEERLSASCAEQFSNLPEDVQREIYAALVESGMAVSRREAVKLREEFLAHSQEAEAQNKAHLASLQAQMQEEQIKLQEKEQELDAQRQAIQALKNETYERVGQDLTPGGENISANAYDNRALEKVKQALITALRERKDIEDKYNALVQLAEENKLTEQHTTGKLSDTESLLHDVKRKVQLQACVGQLKLALRAYTDYLNLSQTIMPGRRSADERALLKELTKNIQALSEMVTTE